MFISFWSIDIIQIKMTMITLFFVWWIIKPWPTKLKYYAAIFNLIMVKPSQSSSLYFNDLMCPYKKAFPEIWIFNILLSIQCKFPASFILWGRDAYASSLWQNFLLSIFICCYFRIKQINQIFYKDWMKSWWWWWWWSKQ